MTSGVQRRLKPAKILLLCGLVSLFLLTRVSFLDLDAPPYKVAYYEPIDEFYYSITAFNLFHYGKLGSNDSLGLPQDSTPSNLLGNVLAAMTLKIFGNTYYGLRMAPVLAGLIAFLLLLWCVWERLDKNWNEAFPYWLLVGFLLLFDYAFYLSNRIFEPTVFRIAVMLMLIIFATKLWDCKQCLHVAVVIGFVTVLAAYYTYLQNAFTVAGVGLFICLASKERFKSSLGYAAGSALGFAVITAVQLHFFSHDSIDTVRHVAQSRVMPAAFLVHGRDILRSNSFLFSPSFFFLVALCSAAAATRIKSWRRIDLAFFCMLVAAVLQLLFVNDFPQRKGIILTPLWAYFVFLGVKFVRADFLRLGGGGKSCYFRFTALLLASATFLYWFTRTQTYSDVTHQKSLQNMALGITLVGAFALILSSYQWRFRSYIFGFSLVGVVCGHGVINGSLFLKYSVAERGYAYRDAMIDMAKHVNGQYLIGGLSYAVRLYNTSRPHLNVYKYQYTDAGKSLFDQLTTEGVRRGARLTVRYSVGPILETGHMYEGHEIAGYIFGARGRRLSLYQVKIKDNAPNSQ